MFTKPILQILEVRVRDSHLTGRADVGSVKFPLRNIPSDGHISTWLPVEVPLPPFPPKPLHYLFRI